MTTLRRTTANTIRVGDYIEYATPGVDRSNGTWRGVPIRIVELAGIVSALEPVIVDAILSVRITVESGKSMQFTPRNQIEVAR